MSKHDALLCRRLRHHQDTHRAIQLRTSVCRHLLFLTARRKAPSPQAETGVRDCGISGSSVTAIGGTIDSFERAITEELNRSLCSSEPQGERPGVSDWDT